MSYIPTFNKSQAFTSGGTWTAPAGVTVATVLAVGGGGGGGAAGTSQKGGGGGGGGQVVMATVPVTAGSAYTVTIGSGGSGGTSGGAGGKGGDTSFGTLVYAIGGYGGRAASTDQPATKIYAFGGAGGGAALAPGATAGAGNLYDNRNLCPGVGGFANSSEAIFYAQPGVLNIAGGGGGHTNATDILSYDGARGPFSASGGSAGTNNGGGGGGGSYGAGGSGGASQAVASAGNSASANTGGGGGGAYSPGTSAASGGAGGSGYCVVYWQGV